MHRITGEAYWSIEAIDTAWRIAADIGRRAVMTAIREMLEHRGYAALATDAEYETFPREVARERAGALWPALDPVAGPFGGTIGSDRASVAGGFDGDGG